MCVKLPEDAKLNETVSQRTSDILKSVKRDGNSKKSFIDGAITFKYYLLNEGTLKDTDCEVQILRVLERKLEDAIRDKAPSMVIQGLRDAVTYQRKVIFDLKEPKKNGQ
jgi:hypothetical protein